MHKHFSKIPSLCWEIAEKHEQSVWHSNRIRMGRKKEETRVKTENNIKQLGNILNSPLLAYRNFLLLTKYFGIGYLEFSVRGFAENK